MKCCSLQFHPIQLIRRLHSQQSQHSRINIGDIRLTVGGDFAVVEEDSFHDLGIDGKQQFVDGYGITPKKLADIAPYLRAFNLLNYRDEVQRATTSKDKPAIARLKARFAGILDIYSIS